MADRREELAGRLFGAGVQSVEMLTVALGDALGLYDALRTGGPATARGLAEHTGVAERYAREWLESQAVSGILDVDNVDAAADERQFSISDAHAEVLTDRDSPFSLAPLAKYVAAFGQAFPLLVDAFQSGGGVSWAQLGPAVAEAQGDFNRPWIRTSLANDFMPAVAGVRERLTADGARVADVGCGAGWAGIALALAYPRLQVDGYDRDEYSIDLSRKHASAEGVADRVRHHVVDVTGAVDDGVFDVAISIEAVHDLPRPVDFLAGVRRMLKPGGVAVIADPRAGEFAAPGSDVDRLLYGASVLCCLPVGLAEQPSAGTGTMIRSATMIDYGTQAGFSEVTVVEGIDHPFTRFFRMAP